MVSAYWCRAPWINFNLIMISKYIRYKVWAEIIYPFQNFNADPCEMFTHILQDHFTDTDIISIHQIGLHQSSGLSPNHCKWNMIWWKIRILAKSRLNVLTSRFRYFSQTIHQSSRSPKVVVFFSATNFSSYIIELLQLHDSIQIKCNYAWIHYNIAIRSQLII